MSEDTSFNIKVSTLFTFASPELANEFKQRFLATHAQFKDSEDHVEPNQVQTNFCNTDFQVSAEYDVVSMALLEVDEIMQANSTWYSRHSDDPRFTPWRDFMTEFYALTDKIMVANHRLQMAKNCPHDGLHFCVTCNGNAIDNSTGLFINKKTENEAVKVDTESE